MTAWETIPMARDSGGTWSAPTGNPVVDGTAGTAAWANTTVNDLGAEITDSLSRSGKGGMTAALKVADGSVGSPSYTFTNDSGMGLYRSASGEISGTAGGSAIWKWTSAGFWANLIQSLSTGALRLLGREAASGSAVGVISDTPSGYGTGDKIHSFRMNTAEKASIDYAGYLTAPNVTKSVWLTSNVTTTSNSMVNVTGLSFTVAANTTYLVEASLQLGLSGSTTLHLDFTGPASPTLVMISSTYGLSPGPTVQWSSGSAFSTAWLALNGSIVNVPCYVKATIINGANSGTVQLRFRNNDGSSTATVYAGSLVRYVQL
jgi:hypothetical protein